MIDLIPKEYAPFLTFIFKQLNGRRERILYSVGFTLSTTKMSNILVIHHVRPTFAPAPLIIHPTMEDKLITNPMLEAPKSSIQPVENIRTTHTIKVIYCQKKKQQKEKESFDVKTRLAH